MFPFLVSPKSRLGRTSCHLGANMSVFRAQHGPQNGRKIDGLRGSRANLCSKSRKCQNLYHSQAKTLFLLPPGLQKTIENRWKIDLKSILCWGIFSTLQKIGLRALRKLSCWFFNPKKKILDPKTDPQNYTIAGMGASGALLTALLGPKWARMASRTPQRPPNTAPRASQDHPKTTPRAAQNRSKNDTEKETQKAPKMPPKCTPTHTHTRPLRKTFLSKNGKRATCREA